MAKILMIALSWPFFQSASIIHNKADNSAIGAELTSQRSNLTVGAKGNQDKNLLI